jgi:hypothetical protein
MNHFILRRRLAIARSATAIFRDIVLLGLTVAIITNGLLAETVPAISSDTSPGQSSSLPTQPDLSTHQPMTDDIHVYPEWDCEGSEPQCEAPPLQANSQDIEAANSHLFAVAHRGAMA